MSNIIIGEVAPGMYEGIRFFEAEPPEHVYIKEWSSDLEWLREYLESAEDPRTAHLWEPVPDDVVFSFVDTP